MTQWKSRSIVRLGVFVLLGAMTACPSFVAESHGEMMHGGHDQNEQDNHGGHYLKHLLKHAKDIGLTQEQIGKLKTLQLDYKRTEARLEADTKIAKIELYALLEDEQADLDAIQAKIDQLKKAEGACLVTSIKSKRDAVAMLTLDQREKDGALQEQMKAGGQHGSGMGGMGRGGMMGGMGGMMGSMGSGGHGQSSGDRGGGASSGGQQHQH